MTSVLVKAARAALRERQRFTQNERVELRMIVASIEGNLGTPVARAQRGEAAVGLFGYDDTFETMAAIVMTDIMHAARARGVDPLKVLALASNYFAREETDHD